jgi:hypothetical protein
VRALIFLLLAGCAGEASYVVRAPKPFGESHHAWVKGCQGGCALVRNKSDELSPLQIEALINTATRKPVGEESPELDMLLFHDNEARAYFLRGDPNGISPEWSTWLRRELGRTVATFSLRMIDEHGVERARVPETPMALGVKLHMQVDDGQHTGPFNANGTVVRVGRDHVWIRM